MTRPYISRKRLNLRPQIEGLKEGDSILILAAPGSVKSIVSRWRNQPKNWQMRFRTKKTEHGTIVTRLGDVRARIKGRRVKK